MVKTFLHSGKLGDIIWALPTIKYFGGGKLYIKANELDGTEIKLTNDSVKSIIPLLEKQSYIHGVDFYMGDQHIDHDLNQFRNVIFRIPGITISQSVFLGQGIKDNIDEYINEPWLTADKDPNLLNKIVVCRTNRYLVEKENINPFYIFLKERNISKHGVFVGTKKEHEIFENTYQLKISYYETPTILDLAKAISSSKFYVGNENLANAINEAMKKISFLEINRAPLGKNFCLFNRPDLFII